MSSDDKIMSAQQFLEEARKATDPNDIRCPYCGMREMPFQHYMGCRTGEEIESFGYVVGWVDKTIKKVTLE